jgi:aminocarboxymuconate-semialdehyde decarboxylase
VRIDVHNHAIPPGAFELLNSDPVYRVRIADGLWQGGHHVDFAVTPAFVDPEAKLAELERGGLEGAVVSVIPPLTYTDLDEEPFEALARAANAGLASWQEAHPSRFRWLAHVPISAPERAAAVLEDAARDGAVGVQVPTNVAGRRIDEAEFEPFWAAAERLGLPVTLHPFGNEPHPALSDWYLQNVIGNQLETTIAIERILCAGVLDRHPGLRLVLVHAGGYFPYQAGRLRHARTVRRELAAAPADPWAYVGRILFDTITHDPQALRYLVSRVGAENVLMGTDLPFDMATPNAMEALAAAVDAETARRIAEENPARLYRFD